MTFSYDTIYQYIEIAYKDARKNVKNSKDVKVFERNLKRNLTELATAIYMRTYDTQYLKCFIIYDPVMREVFAPHFKDRIVSHFIYNCLMPIYERTFIYDSYSCRVGKGTHFGADRADHHLRSCSDNYKKETYVLQMDISGYFMSINNNILYDRVKEIMDSYRYRKDTNGMVYDDYIDFDLLDFLQRMIIFRHPLNKCYRVGNLSEWNKLPPNKSMFNSPDGVGLIIGDLMSQVFSNVHLSKFDNYVTQTLHYRHYGRYVDDAYIMSNDKKELKALIPKLIAFLRDELHLTLHPHKTKIVNMWQGFTFLGFDIRPYHITVRDRTMHRVRERMYELAHGIPKDYRKCGEVRIYHALAVINSCLGHLNHVNTYNIRKKLIEDNPILRKYFILDGDYRKAELKSEIKAYLIEKQEIM